MKRITKSQVEKALDTLSRHEGSALQYHDLKKVYNPHRDRYAWRVAVYAGTNYLHKYIGDTLAECMEYVTLSMGEAENNLKAQAELASRQ